MEKEIFNQVQETQRVPGRINLGGIQRHIVTKLMFDYYEHVCSSTYHISLVFFYFIFSTPISFSLCFPISPSLLYFLMLSQAFIKCSRKAFVYT